MYQVTSFDGKIESVTFQTIIWRSYVRLDQTFFFKKTALKKTFLRYVTDSSLQSLQLESLMTHSDNKGNT